MTPPRSTFLSAAVSALLFLGEAQGLRNDSVNGIVDAATFFREGSEVLSVPLRRVDQDGVATPSLARRFFKTDVLGVFGAAYLAQCELPLLAHCTTTCTKTLRKESKKQNANSWSQ